MTPWPPERLDDRFKAIDDALADTQYHLRAFAPVVGQVAVIEANMATARADLKELRDDITRDRAENRGEILRVIFVLVAVFATITGLAVGAVLTGLVG